jgi:hypothetical protein
MKTEIHKINEKIIAEIVSDNIVIASAQDALDLMVECDIQGAGSIIICEKNLKSDFFDLKSGFAGEILQKFSNYRMKLAIVGDFSKYTGKSLKDFIFESNRTGRVMFVQTIDEAINLFSK